jgi:predicted secreted hydrolase
MSLKKSVLAACLILILVAGLGALWWIGQGVSPPTENGSPRDALAAWLKETEQFFPREMKAKPFAFPRDHGPHPDAPLEAWEFSGTLATPEGRQFGFQWSLFRLGLRPDEPQRKSAWATREVYRGLFTVSDEADRRFHSFERFGRAALGLAGSEAVPQRIWLENWTMAVSQVPGGTAVFDLSAASEDITLRLRLASIKTPVVPGDGGFLGQGGNNRLRAYFLSRLQAKGSVEINRVSHAVTGQAWLTRTWGSALPPGGQTALNRYQIQLDDGREIVALQLHRRDDSAEPINSGFWIEKDGHTKLMERDDLKIEATGHWVSAKTGARYPVRWKILLPRERLELDLLPLLEGQEVKASQRTWSGSVRVTGKIDGSDSVSGSGFVDLSGY